MLLLCELRTHGEDMYESVLWQRVFECREMCTCNGIPLENTTDTTPNILDFNERTANGKQLLYTAMENPERALSDFSSDFFWTRLAKGRRFGRRGDDQVSCIIATQNLALTPAEWGENPVSMGRNLTIAGPPFEEDEEKSEDACRVHPSGEIQLLVGDQRDYLFAQASNNDTFYLTYQNIRLSALLGAALGDSGGSSAGQSGFEVGFHVIGVGFNWLQNVDTDVHRGFIADNLHVISDCGDGRFP
eukprot:1173599-Prorocentrum_minimum.AAC.1